MGNGMGVVVHKPCGVHGALLQRTGHIGCCMQVIRALLGVARGEDHILQNVRALRGGHGLEHVNSPVHRVAFAQMQRGEILMDKGERIVEVKQISVHGTVANNGGRELRSAVNGIIQSKGKRPGTNVRGFVHIVNIVKENQVREVADNPLNERTITGGINHCLTAVLDLAVFLPVRVQAGNGIALGFIFLGKFCNVLVGCVGSLLGSDTDFHRVGAGCVVNFSAGEKALDIVGIGGIINIAESLIAALLVGNSAVALHFGIVRVAGKNGGTIHQGINQHHNQNDNANRR